MSSMVIICARMDDVLASNITTAFMQDHGFSPLSPHLRFVI